ncbi:MAG: hypothetical protein J6V25_02440 [Oscillospiraceae bacterium]|nr:hypothetical protein [Oscillospiraceae bacterium]
MATLSLIGLYTWNDHLFDDMSFPADFTTDDKNTLIANLMMDCAELEVIYPNWDWMKMAIASWSAKELPTWERLYAAMTIQYNPIENYNRTEDSTVSHSGSITHGGIDSNAASGQDSDAHTGYQSVVGTGTDTDTNYRTSFDNNTFASTEKFEHGRGGTDTHNFNDTMTHTNGRTDTLTYGHTITDTTAIDTDSNISGNIGVTTSQQMLEQELAIVPKLNIFNTIIESFKNRFCLLVY